MSLTIAVAHDFICPWCWVGLFQARKLQSEFGVRIEWLSYEQSPRGMEIESTVPKIHPANRPNTPSRYSLLLAADNVHLPLVPKPPNVRTFNAHQAAEYAKTEGVEDALIEAIYRAFWEHGRNINDIEVLCEIGQGIIQDLGKMRQAIETDQFDDKVTEFDENAFATGVYNLPTFFIGEGRLAEQPYSAIRKAMVDLVGREPETSLYSEIIFSNPHVDRPYTFMNMVSTIDGKIITGERDESVHDLGSEIDHLLMRRLESKADAVLVGGMSLRASGLIWNPETRTRIVVSRSGDLPWDSAFLTNDNPIVLTTHDSDINERPGITILRAGESELDWDLAMNLLKERGIEVINILGGSVINAQLLSADLIDEIFMTLAPKIKLGDHTPTIAGGIPLARNEVKNFGLVSQTAIGSEIFLRYKK